jgi:hypothetical protein
MSPRFTPGSKWYPRGKGGCFSILITYLPSWSYSQPEWLGHDLANCNSQVFVRALRLIY